MTPRPRAGHLVLVAALLVGTAPPAAAHHRTAHAADEVARIAQVAPIRGVTWGVHGGDQLWVENRSDRELVVLGDAEEPYLRVGPDGVFENRRSPATYRNAQRSDTATIPADADPEAEPVWREVSDEHAAAWFDHRIHRDDPTAPPTGERADDGAEILARWVVGFQYGGGTLPVFGEIVPVPPANGVAWLALGTLVALTGAVGLRDREPDRAVRPARVLVGLTAVLALPHLLDALLAVPPGGSPSLWRAGTIAAALALAVLGVVRARRADETGLVLLSLGSLGLFLAVGLPGRPALTAGWVDGLAPGWLLRVGVATSLAQLVVTVVVVELVRRRGRPAAAVDPATS